MAVIMKMLYNLESSYMIMNFNFNTALCYSTLTETAYWFHINQLPVVHCEAFSAVYK